MSQFVYLAGGMTDLSVSTQETWRDIANTYITSYYHSTKCLSPCRKTNMTCDEAGCYHRDMWDVKRSSAILVNLNQTATNISLGTMFELGWATMLNIPIVLVIGENSHELYKRHPFIKQCTPFVADSLQKGMDMILEILDV